jgi:hypothetical protein
MVRVDPRLGLPLGLLLVGVSLSALLVLRRKEPPPVLEPTPPAVEVQAPPSPNGFRVVEFAGEDDAADESANSGRTPAPLTNPLDAAESEPGTAAPAAPLLPGCVPCPANLRSEYREFRRIARTRGVVLAEGLCLPKDSWVPLGEAVREHRATAAQLYRRWSELAAEIRDGRLLRGDVERYVDPASVLDAEAQASAREAWRRAQRPTRPGQQVVVDRAGSLRYVIRIDRDDDPRLGPVLDAIEAAERLLFERVGLAWQGLVDLTPR